METSESLRTGRLSVVLPAYNEEESVPLAADVIGDLLTQAGIDHELIFVNDGSRDHTWRAIQEAAARRPQVRGIRFSRNFGKEAAIFAGLAQAKGDCCVVLDCDLQHPPEKILEMYRLWQQGWQVVEGVKISRGKESPLHTLAAKTFYRFLSGATRIDMSHASDFKLLDRRAVDVLVAMREKNAFFRALSSWIGFDTAQVEFEVQPRAAGKRVCVIHMNEPGLISAITAVITQSKLNIENMVNKSKKEMAYTMLDVTGGLDAALADQLAAIPSVIRVRVL